MHCNDNVLKILFELLEVFDRMMIKLKMCYEVKIINNYIKFLFANIISIEMYILLHCSTRERFDIWSILIIIISI